MNHPDPKTTRASLEDTLARDLAELGDVSREGLPSLDESLASVRGGAYRDGTAGAEARAGEMRAARQLELAMLPLATGRVFVHRVSRIAAGATAALCAMFVVLLIADPMLIRLVAVFVPDISASVLGLGSLALALAAYAISGVIAERVFDRRMRDALTSRGDAFADLDALAAGPLRDARAMSRRLDSWATAVPLFGLATCAPLFAFLTLVSPRVHSPYGEPMFHGLTDSWMSSNLVFILFASLVAAVVTAVIARAIRRESSALEPSRLLVALGHWSVVPMAFVFGLVVMVFLGRSIAGMAFGQFPSENLRLFLAVGGTTALMAPLTWLALLVRRRENARLEASDR